MFMTSLRKTGWRQIDAGIWVKPAQVGHVEIAFASANDGSPLYEVTAYDDRGRPSDIGAATQSFSMLETARQLGDMLSTGALDQQFLGRALA